MKIADDMGRWMCGLPKLPLPHPPSPPVGQGGGGTPSLGSAQKKGQLKDMQSGNIAQDELQFSCLYL